MTIERRVRRTVQDYAGDLKSIIQQRYPDAQFELRRISAKEYDLRVYGDFTDMEDIFAITADLPVDILLESGIHIHVLPLGRRQDGN